jgi:Zn-dependent peptidase ImmA (M78 family)
MKKIKSISVMGLTVKIKWVKRMPDGHDNQMAYYDLDLKQIVILDSGTPEQKRATLYHEIFHVWQHRMGFMQEAGLHPYLEIMAESLSTLASELFNLK